jgi:hypothetical protein
VGVPRRCQSLVECRHGASIWRHGASITPGHRALTAAAGSGRWGSWRRAWRRSISAPSVRPRPPRRCGPRCARAAGRPADMIRVRVEIVGSQKCGIVGESQPVLIMINPIIFARARSQRPGPPAAGRPRWLRPAHLWIWIGRGATGRHGGASVAAGQWLCARACQLCLGLRFFTAVSISVQPAVKKRPAPGKKRPAPDGGAVRWL